MMYIILSRAMTDMLDMLTIEYDIIITERE